MRTSRSSLTPFWRGIRRVAELIVLILLRWRVDVRGLEHVPQQGGAILAFNHHSYFDFVMVAWDVVRRRGRDVRFLAKREIWDSRWVGWVIRLARAVPVDRVSASSRHAAYDAAIAALRRGDLVAVAPEQTISPSFELLPFRTGAVRMAQQAGVPIVPAVGWGTQRFASKGHGIRWASRIPVTVIYGEPFVVDPDEDPVTATDRLHKIMAGLLDEIQNDYPDRPTAEDGWWAPARLGGSAPPHDDVLRDHESRTQRWDDEEHRAG